MGVSAENHPAYVEERERLQRSFSEVTGQLKQRLAASEIQIEDTDQFEESMHAIRAAQEALESMRDEAIERLAVAAREPYFGRIDFQERGGDAPQALYIGKSGIQERGTDQPIIIDWRAPVASLFYNTTAGGDELASYDAPEGAIEGLLWLKRNFAIKNRRLEHIADAKVKGAPEEAAGDTFLLYRLQESRDNKLRDIVATIQRGQNAIIRAEKDRPLIIQGVAGSGKTTVALHRLAYLLYTYRHSMLAERMVIFAPNRMFLDYIADVLPELGVGGIRQTTFEDWALENIEDELKLIDPAQRLTAQFAPGRDLGEALDAPGRFKGSLWFREILDHALDRYEATCVPEADLVLWEGRAMKYREIYRLFHEQYKGQPINSRKERITNRIRTWARAQVEPYQGTLREEEKRKAMATAVRRYLALWPRHTPLALYHELLGLGAPHSKQPADLGTLDLPESVTKAARELARENRVSPEDLAPLLYLQERLNGLRDNRELDHVVIDEAQDFSPFQIAMLRRLTKHDSFTILGDLSQGIHTYAGIGDWSELMAVFPPGAVSYHVLEQSYRSTHEIMNFANQVLMRMGVTEALAKPVYREAEKVRLRQTTAEQLPSTLAAEVKRLQDKYASIAVVCRTETEVEAVLAALKAAGLDPERITADQRKYRGGLSVIPSYLTKGLEFDGVIVPNANADHYRLSRRDAKLLYVVCTRALHDLTVLYTGAISPLLDAIPAALYQ